MMDRPIPDDPMMEGPTGPARAVVVGAGGHAKVVVATLQAAGAEVLGLFDDDAEKRGAAVLGVPVVGPVEEARAAGAPLVVGIGDNRTRRRVVRLLARNATWTTAMHPSAVVHPSVALGPGAVVSAGAVLQPDVHVGAHAVVNTGATVDHDGALGDFAHVAPGAHLAGGAHLGAGAFVGVGAAVLPGVHVGAWTTVGAGATVTADLPPGVVAVGTPARILRSASPST